MRHRRADCRDPLRRIICKRSGHLGKECLQNPRNRRGGGAVKERLGVMEGRGPVHERLVFPDAEMAPADASGTDHLRRPRNSHKVTESTPTMEEQVFLLQQHAVVLTAVNKLHVASPLSVGRVLEKDFKIPPHLPWITNHDPEDFLVYFNLPAHKYLVALQGTIFVDGNSFLAESWRQDAHALHQSWMMHVRVVLEKMPMHLQTLEGENEVLSGKVIIDRLDSRTFERVDTRLFAVWVWAQELAHIPTRRTLWKHARGAAASRKCMASRPQATPSRHRRTRCARTCWSTSTASRTGRHHPHVLPTPGKVACHLQTTTMIELSHATLLPATGCTGWTTGARAMGLQTLSLGILRAWLPRAAETCLRREPRGSTTETTRRVSRRLARKCYSGGTAARRRLWSAPPRSARGAGCRLLGTGKGDRGAHATTGWFHQAYGAGAGSKQGAGGQATSKAA
ncbi:hypothetical protein D1007_45585 [Hordeum vulgare]|nr:hypothetical protein D1007_45585 [Hordeum vulgare]